MPKGAAFHRKMKNPEMLRSHACPLLPLVNKIPIKSNACKPVP
jgi:hypothetical protein